MGLAPAYLVIVTACCKTKDTEGVFDARSHEGVSAKGKYKHNIRRSITMMGTNSAGPWPGDNEGGEDDLCLSPLGQINYIPVSRSVGQRQHRFSPFNPRSLGFKSAK